MAAAGVAVAAEASTFKVAFLTDAVGPKALPYLSAAILVGAGAMLAARPGPGTEWPAPSTRVRMAAAAGAFLFYAAVLPVLGFFVSTTLTVASLSILFGGPPVRSAAAAAALSAVLWYLFVWALRLPLPFGSLWTF